MTSNKTILLQFTRNTAIKD